MHLNVGNKSLVSVIIIFLNMEKFLEETIKSVLAQSYEDWELFLVDDGSTDKSTEIAQRFAAEYPEKIHYREHADHQNLGMSASRNLGAREARGEFIAFLDADDLWLPEKLETHVRILESRPEVGMLFGSCRYWFSWTGQAADMKRDYLPTSRVSTPTLFPPPTLLPHFLEGQTEIPPPCSILARTDNFRKVGGFEEIFRGMYEDQAFYAKICLTTTVLATVDCLAWYRQHPNSNYSTAIQSGQTHSLHFNFLKWLESYCREHNIQDGKVWQAIYRQIWLYGYPTRQRLLGMDRNSMRWIKKWLLKLEERIIPSRIRERLWLRR